MKIVLPEGKGPHVWNRVKCYTDSGHEIEGITKVEIESDFENVVEARITVLVSQVQNLNAQPLLSMESLVEAAERYGYELRRVEKLSP